MHVRMNLKYWEILSVIRQILTHLQWTVFDLSLCPRLIWIPWFHSFQIITSYYYLRNTWFPSQIVPKKSGQGGMGGRSDWLVVGSRLVVLAAATWKRATPPPRHRCYITLAGRARTSRQGNKLYKGWYSGIMTKTILGHFYATQKPFFLSLLGRPTPFPISTSLLYISLFSGCWNIAYGGNPL